jgi:hypothetical protein
MNNFHRQLKIPVEFKVSNFVPMEHNKIDPNSLPLRKTINIVIPREVINPEFHEWIESVGLYIDPTWGRYFESRPFEKYNIHADSLAPELHRTKLNIMFDSYGTEMTGYKLKPNHLNDVIKTKVIRIYQSDWCDEIFRVNTDTPCLFNGSEMHCLFNSENRNVNRKCYSLTLARLSNKELVSFDESIERLKDYIV